jgi:hypothetical protein
MTCAIITGASAAAAETAVNAWLTDKLNEFESIDIKFVSMSEGSIGAALVKVIIFYDCESVNTIVR